MGLGSRENSVQSTKIMEVVYQNIMDQIIEHVIEGICFEAHRAVKLGYFQIEGYRLNDQKFELCTDEEQHTNNVDDKKSNDIDIFGNKAKEFDQYSTCPHCKQQKSTRVLVRHLRSCRAKPTGSFAWDSDGEKASYEKNVENDENNSDGKKGNDANEQQKNAPSYETMSEEQKSEFLLTHCGVISRRTSKPCSKSLNCHSHTSLERFEIRHFIFENRMHLAGDGIDIDTVD